LCIVLQLDGTKDWTLFAARSLKVVSITAPVHGDAEIETAIIGLGREPAGGLVVMPSVFTPPLHALIISAAARNNVPAVYSVPTYVRDGGFLPYGVDTVDPFRRAASYVDRILRGEKPGDLPVQFPTKFEMGPGGDQSEQVVAIRSNRLP
jgi:putative ABC transport system substrate-binding protein